MEPMPDLRTHETIQEGASFGCEIRGKYGINDIYIYISG